MPWMEILANLSAVATAFVAVGGYGAYRFVRWTKRRKLEDYLSFEKANGPGSGQRSVIHLMAKLRLTESEILHASFESKRIKCRVVTDQTTGLADQLLFEAAVK